MLDFLIVVLIVGLLILVMRGVLWLRDVNQRIESARIKSYRVERVSHNRVLVFDGKSHDERRPYYIVDLIDEHVSQDDDTETIDDDTATKLGYVSALISASIAKYGKDDTRIMSANDAQSSSVISRRDNWQSATGFINDVWGTLVINNGDKKGTYSRVPLGQIVRDLAVMRLPRPVKPEAKAQ